MERSDCMRAFLLLVFLSVAHLSPDPILQVNIEGGHAFFGSFRSHFRPNDSMLYRIYEDGDLLLVNCSQPDSPQPDGYNITYDSRLGGFALNNLTMSHIGHYMVERRKGKSSPVETTVYRLTVCAKDVDMSRQDRTRYVYVRDGRAAICEFHSPLGNGSSLQLYRSMGHDTKYLVLDTSSSLEPLIPYWRDRLQVDTNTSTATLSGIMFNDSLNQGTFLCTLWRGGQCQRRRLQKVLYAPPFIFTHEKKNVTLHCTFRGELSEPVYWKTSTRKVIISNDNQTQPQVMHMLNGSQSGDYSLIIPSVSQQHTGVYSCEHSQFKILEQVVLSVCVEFSPVNVMFSRGESVLMDAHVNYSETLHRAQWFRQRGLHPQMLIIESVGFFLAHVYGVNDAYTSEDLIGRVTGFNFTTSLNISNLTAEDSGVYTWRVVLEEFGCYEGSIRLLHRDPFGVQSPFYRAYAPLLSCVLLGVLGAVICLKPRNKGGALTPDGKEMKIQDFGDEDVYDDVDEAEDRV